MQEIRALSEEQIYEKLNTSPRGLIEEEVKKRLEKYGPNQIRELKKAPLIYKFLANFYHLFAILLWVGGILAFIGEMPELGWAIFAVILINAIFSFWQEFKAEKATEALKKLLPSYARVIRNGEHRQILAAELVPGDLILLEEGDNISADARLIQEFEMKTNNATLTGESHPVNKTAEPIFEEGLTLVEAPNLVFAGTNVASGSGRGIIFATGMETQFGKIASLTQTIKEEQSPLQKEMAKVTKLVATLAIGMGILFFFLGTGIAKLTIIEGFLFAVGIIVANVPEGLLPTVTLALAMGVQRMADRHALVKKLSSVETLGCTTVICTDKTGTLTQNEMTVREIWANGQTINVSGAGYEPRGEFSIDGAVLSPDEIKNNLKRLFSAASFCNNAKLLAPSEKQNSWSILGDPTEGALLVAGQKGEFDLEKAIEENPRIYQLPFDSVRKRMSSIHLNQNGQKIAYIKGAPKETLDLCKHIYINGRIEEVTEEHRNQILAQNDVFARGALRVLAMACRELPTDLNKYTIENTETDLVFVGLMAMMDPPRTEVEKAVNLCAQAGIKIFMITGDYGLTAESIARRIGMVKSENCRIITGAELDQIPDEQLVKELTEQEIIFARVSPEHKMRVVSVLKDRGEIVAVTGDGVNDAPALKRADIGVAMGIAGTDVAKEAADIILTDDNFASIVNAIEEGRAVYDNIRRFVTYIFASNIPEIIPFILMVLFKIPLPLTIMQILAVDLGTDMIPALGLGVERPEPGVMDRPPRKQTTRLLNSSLMLRAYFFLGPIETVACMAGFFFMYFRSGWTFSRILASGSLGLAAYQKSSVYVKATTMSLAGIVVTQIGNGFACRTERESVFKIGFFSNRLYLWGILFEIALINILVYTPFFQRIFQLGPLSITDWAFLFIFAPVIFFADELRKFILRRKGSKR